ncbi:PQQ-dependent sugar dehydrogenase [Microbacterium sp. SSM24]|uniref:PQQ-dependent sugar dehydrogenase n=1 Tax=Microbacterium sp. SSM24 TaxID=2991714 RepID=UPI0022266401|nr:PQQ-dependent sugar dehydrogenase [Microbacterium sp. SSM24]MCW3494659.1 PQQ-dependent sugar dehydrogenase [Microbacterium sp. SSM24]
MTRSARIAAVGCLVLAALAASGCAPTPAREAAPPIVSPTSVTPSPSAAATGAWRVDGAPQALATGLAAPWSVVPVRDGGALISQRDDGTVVELTPAGEVRTAGTVPGVVSGGESGLHGLALLERDEVTWLYAYYGASDDNRVVRMPLLGESGALSLGESELVFAGIPRANTHNGGRIAFGPDGMLYVATGDAQNRDAPQDPGALGGKILRLDPEGDPAPGNPWDSAVYSMGHRNVQGLAWTQDGTMWASEFGQDTWDELNRIEAGGNYGWPVVEGNAGREGMIDPVVTWATDDASPSGIAAVGDTVFLASLRGERLWVVDTADGADAGEPIAVLAGDQGRLRDAVAAPDGTLWVLTNNTDGRGSPRPEDDLLLRLRLAPAP